jgi:hypothetical protein
MPTEIEARAGDNICDFCSQPNPTRYFNAPDFKMDEPHPDAGLPGFGSKGAWAACPTCAAFIENLQWDGLLQRGVNKLAEKYGSMMPRRVLTDTVKRSHDLFRAHYEAGKQ